MFVLLVLLLIVLAFGFSGLVMWGIGSFIVWAFGISFVWTYWHGLAVAFIIWILSSIFKGDQEEQKWEKQKKKK